MPFKIVSTVERGKNQLCIVPSHWEHNGNLKWPTKGADKLAKDEHSSIKPEWPEISCVVKRKDLQSYKVAKEELTLMLNKTETEQEDEGIALSTQRPGSSSQVDLNSLADQLIMQQSENNETQPTIIIVSDEGKNQQHSQQQEADFEKILQNQSVLFEVTNLIIDNQKKIMHKLASMSVQIEESFSKIEDNVAVTSLKECSGTAENESFYFKQIKNINDLENLETQLNDSNKKNKIKKICSLICTGGPGTGKNCAFRLIDVFFAREFLCLCSWSGSTRKDGIKVSLKCYKQTIDLFFEIIYNWDNKYTKEENENFFKDVLKNSNKRKNAKNERIPTKRHRKSKNDTSNVQINDNKTTTKNVQTEETEKSEEQEEENLAEEQINKAQNEEEHKNEQQDEENPVEKETNEAENEESLC